MKYRIEEQDEGVEIEIEAPVASQGRLLESFQECREGRCTCPTEEYGKLDSLGVESQADLIRLRLKAKSGERFDQAELEKCLRHTMGKGLES